VVVYDRRGNSRSPRPDDWQATSIEEQADDAANLVAALGLEDVIVFGTSWGALIALDLALRFPRLVDTVVIHEAPLFGALADADEVERKRRAVVGPALAKRDYAGAFSVLIESNNGNVLDDMDASLRERLLGNARTFFELELPGFATYLPSDETLGACRQRIVVAAGETGRGSAISAATALLAARLRTELVLLPGGHAPYLDPQPGPRNFGSALAALLTEGDVRPDVSGR
jgi:pimeloyl-ACP methyl ester carboxylesterase